MSTKKLQIIGSIGGSGSNIELDTTLTQEGKAADAKAVGDALTTKVSFAAAQELTEEQKEQACKNIGASKDLDWVRVPLYRGFVYVANSPNISDTKKITNWEELCAVEGVDEDGETYGVFGSLMSTLESLFACTPTSSSENILLFLSMITQDREICLSSGFLPEFIDIYIKFPGFTSSFITNYTIDFNTSTFVLTVSQRKSDGTFNQYQYNTSTNEIVLEHTYQEYRWAIRYTDEKVAECIKTPKSAAVGQAIVVKAVDDTGKPIEWEAVDPWVITSSTEGSTKKFKLTIDDDGVLTATEIVESAT